LSGWFITGQEAIVGLGTQFNQSWFGFYPETQPNRRSHSRLKTMLSWLFLPIDSAKKFPFYRYRRTVNAI
jgi:hypothetical protein